MVPVVLNSGKKIPTQALALEYMSRFPSMPPEMSG